MEICSVCGDHSTGRHYGANTCEGCKLFFKRSIKKRLYYTCRVAGCCPISKRYRNSCQYCRMRKCLSVGMKREAVQQTKAQDYEKQRRRQKRQHQKGTELRKEADFASLSDFVLHLQEVEPYCRKSDKESTLSTSSLENSTFSKEYLNSEKNSEKISETAARLLFMTVHWAKKVKHFSELSHFDQVTLLRENWCKVFIINLVQWAMPFELAPLVGEVFDKTPQDHLDKVLQNMGKLNEVVFKLVQLQLDRAEFSLLKALALFNPDTDHLADAVQIQAIQNKTQNALEEYIRVHHAQIPNRFGQTLIRLAALGSVESRVIEHVFFNHLLGGASIYTVVDGILRTKDLQGE